MSKIASAAVAVLALIQSVILLGEVFAWPRMASRLLETQVAEAGKVGFDLIEATGAMALNQGLYNGFLAAGLIWALLASEPLRKKRLAVFFVICVGIAGLVGAVTVSFNILFIQAVPALIALVLIAFNFADNQR